MILMKKMRFIFVIFVLTFVTILAFFVYKHRYYIIEREAEKFFEKNNLELHLQIKSISKTQIEISKISFPKSKIYFEDLEIQLLKNTKIFDFKIDSVLIKKIKLDINALNNKLDLTNFEQFFVLFEKFKNKNVNENISSVKNSQKIEIPKIDKMCIRDRQ